MFKDSFKYYKSKVTPPELDDVVDIAKAADKCNGVIDVGDIDGTSTMVRDTRLLDVQSMEHKEHPPGLLPLTEWRVYQLSQRPGLLLIRNPFTTQGQRYWMARCLRDYCQSPPGKVNLNAHLFQPHVLSNWWKELQSEANGNKDEYRRLRVSMRWATLGYHHNWDTKVYDKTEATAFPTDMSALCDFFASALGFGKFNAEAAIVNYYPIGTTLAGHTDHSEPNNRAPLFSFSFGQTAIFLIGGKTKEEKPTALYLRSGDVMVMSGDSRLCYHAVPRVMKESRPEIWNFPVIAPNTTPTLPPKSKKMRLECEEPMENEQLNHLWSMDMRLFRCVADELFWLPYKTYLNDSRINVNVRQVHALDKPNADEADAFS